MDDKELAELCGRVVESLPRLEADPSLGPVEKEFVKWIKMVVAKN